MKRLRPQRVRLGDGRDAFKIGEEMGGLEDLYSQALTTSWPIFIAAAGVVYLAINLVFATAFTLVRGSIVGARPGVFIDALFFSQETLATVGYGVMSPGGVRGHMIASVEIFTGLFLTATLTGLVFARIARPKAQILFSDKGVIAPFDGGTALMFRVAGRRAHVMAEASARMTLLAEAVEHGGKRMRRIIDLKLERSSTPVLALSWLLIHRIDAVSPFYGLDQSAMTQRKYTVMLAISGLDEAIAAQVADRRWYRPADIAFNSVFADVIVEKGDDAFAIDLRKFHDVEPLDPEFAVEVDADRELEETLAAEAQQEEPLPRVGEGAL